jgi:hypothetical protein
MILESPTRSAVLLEIDRLFGAARASLRPVDHVSLDGTRTFGHYRLAARSGAITGAAVVAGAPLFSLRWTAADAVLLLFFLEAYFVPTTLFTAAQELGLDAILASGFTVADSAGTPIVPTSVSRARRGTMNPSLVDDLRIAATTLLTAGTRTLDTNPFVAGSGLANVVNAAAATEYVNPAGGAPPFGFRFEANLARGEHPIVLARDEGLLVRNAVAFPAAGAATLIVNGAYAEVANY